jgi:hypothetical protein
VQTPDKSACRSMHRGRDGSVARALEPPRKRPSGLVAVPRFLPVSTAR